MMVSPATALDWPSFDYAGDRILQTEDSLDKRSSGKSGGHAAIAGALRADLFPQGERQGRSLLVTN